MSAPPYLLKTNKESADLLEMAEVWTDLPMSIRHAIVALIQPYLNHNEPEGGE